MSTNLLAVTSIVPKLLASGQVAGTSATTVYTVPASTTAKVSQASITNVSAAPVTVSVEIVPSGSSAASSRRVVSDLEVLADDTIPLKDYLAGHMLGPGDFISITSSAVTAINYTISGTEHS